LCRSISLSVGGERKAWQGSTILSSTLEKNTDWGVRGGDKKKGKHLRNLVFTIKGKVWKSYNIKFLGGMFKGSGMKEMYQMGKRLMAKKPPLDEVQGVRRKAVEKY